MRSINAPFGELSLKRPKSKDGVLYLTGCTLLTLPMNEGRETERRSGWWVVGMIGLVVGKVEKGGVQRLPCALHMRQ